MIVNRAKTPVDGGSRAKNRDNVKWRLENTSEASVLGNQFAQVIMMVASGSADQVLHKKKAIPPCKTVFWEEPRFNPAIENTNDTYAHNAHHIEETNNWKKGGKRFVGGPRFAVEPNKGPTLPAEYAHLYEKPTVVFERSGQLRPFSRARQFNKPHEHCSPNPERAYLEMRTSLIGPSTYQLPDFWDASVSHSLDPKLSSMRSSTPRFPTRKGLRSEFPVEKSGTSIPHSRGRSRGAGFKETTRPLSEGQIAAKLAAASISTWDSYQEAPSPEYDRVGPASVNTDSIISSNLPADKFYEVSVVSKPHTGAGTGKRLYQSHSTSRNNMSMSTGSLLERNSVSPPARRVSTALAGGSTSHANSFSLDGNASAGSTLRRKSSVPGFTFSTKNAQPLFPVPDYHKSYQRMVLPDGSVGIMPVSTEGGGVSTPLNLNKAVSFNVDPRSPGGPLDPVMQLLGSSGPQIRSITPPHPSPPSLTRNNLYSSLQGLAPTATPLTPTYRKVTREGTVLDDESTYVSHSGKSTANNTASSYGQAVMQKWVPPVSYSSRTKGPVPDIGAIPYKPKKQAAYGVRRSVDQYALDSDNTLARSFVDEFMPLDGAGSHVLTSGGSNMRPLSSGEGARRSSKMGGMNAGERKRQDSLGAQQHLTDVGLRKLASRDSAQVLHTVESPHRSRM